MQCKPWPSVSMLTLIEQQDYEKPQRRSTTSRSVISQKQLRSWQHNHGDRPNDGLLHHRQRQRGTSRQAATPKARLHRVQPLHPGPDHRHVMLTKLPILLSSQRKRHRRCSLHPTQLTPANRGLAAQVLSHRHVALGALDVRCPCPQRTSTIFVLCGDLTHPLTSIGSSRR